MATLFANEAITISHIAYLGHIADTGPGSMHHRTATGLIFTQGSIDFVFTGFGIHYISGFPISGTITGLNILHNGVSAYKFTNFHMSVPEAASVWTSHNPSAVIARHFTGADHFTGSDFADVLAGFGGNDVLNGRGSDDHLAGGPGNDTLFGGAGNDFLSGGAGNDTLDGGPGSDTADYSEKTGAVSVVLNGSSFANVRVGGVVEDKVMNIENVTGGTGADRLTGDGLANVLAGRGGNDVLNGGDGNDRLVGGAGADRFVFDHALDAATNSDTIVDFAGASDRIVLDHAIFTMLSPGILDASHFALTAPGDADDFIVYDQATGALSYYADGNGGAGVQFATLANLASLTNAAILVA